MVCVPTHQLSELSSLRDSTLRLDEFTPWKWKTLRTLQNALVNSALIVADESLIFFRCKARYWLSRKILQKHLEFLTRGISWAKSFGLPQCCSQTTSFTAFLPEKKHTKNTFFTQLIFHSSYKAAISRQVTGVATEKWTIFDMNSKIPAARFLEDPRLRPTKATEVFQALWWGKLGETSKNHHQIVLVIISVFREIHPNLSVCVFFRIIFWCTYEKAFLGVPWYEGLLGGAKNGAI